MAIGFLEAKFLYHIARLCKAVRVNLEGKAHMMAEGDGMLKAINDSANTKMPQFV